MSKQKDSEDLVRVGPGTVMGGLMRQYWIPAAMSSELEPDGAPLRLILLGERLIAFRDTEGRYGLMDEFCAHRGVSLWFGRNEESGLRCSYHGWKYDVNGQCVEIPSEPDERHSSLCAKIKLTSYPLVKIGEDQWGQGKAKDAIATIQAGMKKPLDDKNNAAVRLGMAYLGAGQKADAQKTFDTVKGPETDKSVMIAHLWSLYARH